MAVRIDCGDGYVNVSFATDEQTKTRHATAIRQLVDYLRRRDAEQATHVRTASTSDDRGGERRKELVKKERSVRPD